MVTKKHELRAAVRRAEPTHVGPLPINVMMGILRDADTTADKLASRPVVDGVLALVSAELLAEPTLVCMGQFVLRFEGMNSPGQEMILKALTDHPLPLKGADGEAWTPRQRLGEAIYGKRFPEMWETFTDDGKQRKALKKLDNAVQAFKRSETRMQEMAALDLLKQLHEGAVPLVLHASEAEGLPYPATVPVIGVEDAGETERPLPRTAKSVFVAMYEATRKVSVEETRKERTFITALFLDIGFSKEDVRKFQDTWLNEGGFERDKAAHLPPNSPGPGRARHDHPEEERAAS